MIEPTPDNMTKMARVAEALDGTCRTLEDALIEVFGENNSDVNDYHIDLLDELDNRVLECESCGWWSDASEFDDEQCCLECSDE